MNWNTIYSDLEKIYNTCNKSDWDGYNAEPVSRKNYLLAKQFLGALPFNVPPTSLGAEPDGCITFEWVGLGSRRIISISIDDTSMLHYAVQLGAVNHYDFVKFNNVIPSVVLDYIVQVSKCYNHLIAGGMVTQNKNNKEHLDISAGCAIINNKFVKWENKTINKLKILDWFVVPIKKW